MAVTFVGASSAAGSPLGSTTLFVPAPPDSSPGNALVLVATLIAIENVNATITASPGWTVRHDVSAPHARVMLTREATGTSDDNAHLTASHLGAFCATMACYRGIDPDAWEGDTSVDTQAPYASAAHDSSSGAIVCAFSMQNNSGLQGVPTQWVAVDGSLREAAWSGRAGGYGGSNGIIDKLNAAGAESVSVMTTGSGEVGAAAQWLELWNTEVLPEQHEPALDAPVTLYMGETLHGVFADPGIDVAYFENVDMSVGQLHALGDQLSSEAWYRFAIRDRSRSRGLISYVGETLMARLARMRPRESLILVAGEGGVPDPLLLQECLARFLAFYGVPHDPSIPPFFLRTSDGIVTPTADAFVIQPNQERPESIFEWLERFFGPFRGYTWRADEQDRLVVKPPAWGEVLGVRLHLHYRDPLAVFTSPKSVTVPWPWPGRAPNVAWAYTSGGVVTTGETGALTVDTQDEVTVAPHTFEVTWASAGNLKVELTAPLFLPMGPPYDAVFIARPTGGDSGGGVSLTLTNTDLGPDEIETSTADSVINQAVVPVRRRTFSADQALMQPAVLIQKSPEQLMAGAFGSNPPFGPMAWDPDTPGGYIELANEAAQGGTWFWPVDPGVVIQPGGDVAVSFEVDEWAEQWRSPGSTPYAAASQVNTFNSSAVLPTNGSEVKLFDFQFPRQTSNFAPSPYGATGTVWARWRAGEEPGIEIRISNARFVEFGFLWEGIGGQTVYFLWGYEVRLNGTGTTWTVGDLEVHRFGFSRDLAGTWEGGAALPGLAQSQALFPNRVYEAPELPYEVDPATALAIARGIVEENHVPKVVYQLPIVPSRADGWAYHPRLLGDAASVSALGVRGRITAHAYHEAHSPGGSTSDLTIDVEVTQALAGTPASPSGRRFGRGYYGVSHYQQED